MRKSATIKQMKAKEIVPGLKINYVTIVSRTKKPNHLKQGGSYWVYQCVCGKEVITHATTICRGIISCGCLSHPKKYNTTDTKYYRRLYHVWVAMNKRCYDPKNKNYPNYGALGIKIEGEWRESFSSFYNDMIETYQPGLTLERKDVDGPYNKKNCTWIPNEEQAKNRRSSLTYRMKNNKPWKFRKKGLLV